MPSPTPAPRSASRTRGRTGSALVWRLHPPQPSADPAPPFCERHPSGPLLRVFHCRPPPSRCPGQGPRSRKVAGHRRARPANARPERL
ncbi:hypothetical protein CVV68_13680 [Arthrobacter livingstonensis]|uniref:Uncharacterized protein n=1 Tax=Arthrobacter livingstonensis TaxID=670078 RepID=A0A2V5L8B1_9MICC|nr:hypothetical protein CVV68_13680 [Arthrobacter livingstonensis]